MLLSQECPACYILCNILVVLAIFDKVDVRSRKEVLAKLFFDRYLRAHAADRRPSPYGWFLDDGR